MVQHEAALGRLVILAVATVGAAYFLLFRKLFQGSWDATKQAAEPPKNPMIAWPFLPAWVIATTAGYALIPILLYLHGGPDENGPTDWLFFCRISLLVAAVAAPTALLQWLVLRVWTQAAIWWIPMSTLASVLGFQVLLVGFADWESALSQLSQFLSIDPRVLSFAVSGPVQGIIEWLLLRQWFPRAGWWVLARSIATFGSLFAFFSLAFQSVCPTVLMAVSYGLISGGVTGLALARLLRHPLPTEAYPRATFSK